MLKIFSTENFVHSLCAIKSNDQTYNQINANNVVGRQLIELFEALRINNTIRDFTLVNSHLDCESARYLSETLKVNTTLRKLIISFVSVTPEEIKYLTEALKVNSTLHVLSFESIFMKDESARHLADLLSASHETPDLVRTSPGVVTQSSLHSQNSHSEKSISTGTVNQRGLLTLDLRGCNVRGRIKYLSEALKVNNCLGRLDLNDNFIDHENIQYLAEALKVNRSLYHLDVSGNRFGYEGVRCLIEALKINRILRSLDLGGTRIGTEGVKLLADFIRTPYIIVPGDSNTESRACSLEELYLANNDIGSEDVKYLADSVSASHRMLADSVNTSHRDTEHRVLHTLGLDRNNIRPEGAKYLFQVLILNNTVHSRGMRGKSLLQVLKLGSNNIGHQSVKYLMVEALKMDNITLSGPKTLHLHDNKLGPEGIKYLVDALSVISGVRELDIGSNNIGPEGAMYTANLIRAPHRTPGDFIRAPVDFPESNTLENLILSKNDIKSEGLKYLVEALKTNSTLHTLDVNYQDFKPEDVQCVLEALEINNTLYTFHVWYERNDRWRAVMGRLSYLLDINRTLYRLNHTVTGSLEIQHIHLDKKITDFYLLFEHSPLCQPLPTELINELMKSYLMELKIHPA